MWSQHSMSRALAVAAALAFAAASTLAEQPQPAQVSLGELVTITGEITALDAAKREITLRGPLGGEIDALVAEDVKNLDQVKVGDLVTVGYFQAVVLRATRQGDTTPLFAGGDAETAAPGERPAARVSRQHTATLTVSAVDAATGSIVLAGPDGVLQVVEVESPEMLRKLEQLKVGDTIDAVYTEELAVEVKPATPGAKPGVTRESAILVVESGEVVHRVGNTLMIRGERGRILKVAVDPDYRFEVNGAQVGVQDLKPGTKLTRTVLRVSSSEYVAE